MIEANKQNLEKKISKYFDRKYCLLTGNGTTSMYLFFATLKKKSIILFPAITCMQAVNAAIFAGHKILYTDVSINSFAMEYENFLEVVKNKKIDVVVPTHIFGHVVELSKIINYCNKNNILVLEDATQSMGGKIENKKVGSFGDASVMSFGYSKIIDCGGGGCILTDHLDLYKKIKKQEFLIPKKPVNYINKINQYKKFYYINKKKLKKNIFCEKLFLHQKKKKNLFIYKIDLTTINKILKKIETIRSILKIRKENYNLYKYNLSKKKIIIPKLSKHSVSWRFNFLLKNKRNELVEFLRKINIDVSTWYPSLHYYPKQMSDLYRNSKKIEKNIVNLWTDEYQSTDKVKKNISIINSYFKNK